MFPARPSRDYGAFVASQLTRATTVSGFVTGESIAVPTSLPSFIRPTDRIIIFGAFFGDSGSLYAADVTIMLSPSNFIVVAVVSFEFPNTNFPVESLVLRMVNV